MFELIVLRASFWKMPVAMSRTPMKTKATLPSDVDFVQSEDDQRSADESCKKRRNDKNVVSRL